MIVGKFITECKNRFLCLVELDGSVEECYVSSSSKLSQYIELSNKKVLLEENKGKKLRTKYTLQAVQINGRWILLNLNCINDIYYEYLKECNLYKSSLIQREAVLEDYKTDFYIGNQNMIVEVKGILSEDTEVVYPRVSCGRMLRQLCVIKNKILEGYHVEYVFILMNKNIRTIRLNEREEEIQKIFRECITLGMQVKFYDLSWYRGKCRIKNQQNCTIN